MQNKPNLLDAQMNVGSVKTKDYENKRLCRCGENKPNSKPNKADQSQFSRPTRQNKPNTNPNKPNLCHRYQTQLQTQAVLRSTRICPNYRCWTLLSKNFPFGYNILVLPAKTVILALLLSGGQK